MNLLRLPLRPVDHGTSRSNSEQLGQRCVRAKRQHWSNIISRHSLSARLKPAGDLLQKASIGRLTQSFADPQVDGGHIRFTVGD